MFIICRHPFSFQDVVHFFGGDELSRSLGKEVENVLGSKLSGFVAFFLNVSLSVTF
jgi:hypothetical protein